MIIEYQQLINLTNRKKMNPLERNLKRRIMKENFIVRNSMKIGLVQYLLLGILSCLFVFTSCNDDDGLVTHRNCGEVETEITDMDYQVGSYISSSFSDAHSINFEEAAISIFIEDWTFTSDEDRDCYTFTPLPQSIEEIKIKSSSSVTFEGVEYNPEEELNGLFIIHDNEQDYSVMEFISIQNNEPLIFHDEDDELVFQLLTKPDVAIDQPLNIEFSFNDSKVLQIEISNFEVMN